ncbi:pogo transposable [Alternaria alternata]|nr:pogo transposable [Alternaria alternata]
MSSIEAALAAFESLEPEEPLVYSRIANTYGCSRITLARRHQHLQASRSDAAHNRQAVRPQQEQELLRYIERLTRQGLPPTWSMIRRFASSIAGKELGVH